MSNYSLVLLGRYPGKDKPVAQALGRAFGRDEGWGLPIVGATPINLLTGLTSAQAQAIHSALSEVEQAGSKIQVQPVADESCPTVKWPGEPRVFGRPVNAYGGGTMVAGGGTALACPHCGKPIQVRLLSAAQPAPAAAPAPGAPQPINLPAPVPVPVTGVAAPRRTPAFGMAVQTGEPPTPRRPSPPVPIPVPVPQAQAPRPVPAPQPASDFSSAPDGLEELVPIQDFAPTSMSTPAQPMRAPQPAKLLPEVPVVDSGPPMQPFAAPPLPPPNQSGHGMGVPVDLDAFEAGLQMGPAPEAPEQAAPSEHVAPPVKPGARRRGPPVDPDALCSVFIGKSRDPKVHELVAEIQGTSVEEAEDLCQKAVVPVVKDIPVGEAEGIKQKFLELKVNPRIAVKR